MVCFDTLRPQRLDALISEDLGRRNGRQDQPTYPKHDPAERQLTMAPGRTSIALQNLNNRNLTLRTSITFLAAAKTNCQASPYHSQCDTYL